MNAENTFTRSLEIQMWIVKFFMIFLECKVT